MRRAVLLAALLAAVPAAPARAGDAADGAAVVLPIEIADDAASNVWVELPPSLFAHLRWGTDDAQVVDADGRPLATVLRVREGNDPAARADLEPVVAARSEAGRSVSLLVDLRVRSAPGLEIALDLRGEIGTPLRVEDAADPREGPWEELHFVADESADGAGGVAGVSGRALVPAGEGRRWVRVVMPTRDPSGVRVERLAATIKRHRLNFRPGDGRAPFRLAAGYAERPGAVGPSPPAPVVGWETGAGGTVAAPGWLPPEAGLEGDLPRARIEPGRPFPWAETVATLVFLALTIWAVLLRKEG